MAQSFFDMLRAIFLEGNAPKKSGEESLLHVGWQQREESFYPALFGLAAGSPALLKEDIFKKDFGRRDVHPFWLHHGVVTFPPTPQRPTWLYATSGLSNAFDSEIEEWSGLGVEYIMETPAHADWAADKLARLMAFNLLITAGHYQGQSDLTVGSIVRLGVPVNGDESCTLTNIIALKPTTFAQEFQLVTGKVELLQMLAVSDSEADFAENEGHDALAEKLQAAGRSSIIDVERDPVV